MKPELFAQAVEEFKQIYYEEFGIELNEEEATTRAKGLLQLFYCLTEGERI